MKLYKLIFVATTFSFMLSIFLLNNEIAIGKVLENINNIRDYVDLFDIVSYFIYFIIPLLLTWLETRFFFKLDRFEIKKENINKIEPASTIFLPVFLAYVFVGLGINTFTSFVFIYLTVVILCFFAEIYLYNPFFHVLGYRFYFVTIGNFKLLIMTRKEIKLRDVFEFKHLGRINDFTYIDIEK